MKRILTITAILLGIFLLSCKPCNIICGPCAALHTIYCECVINLECQCSDGIQNGNEIGIDCGGDCPECFNCFTDNCVLLSGAISAGLSMNKKWISLDKDWAFNFYNMGTVFEDWGGGSANGTWSFDDPDLPTKLIISHENVPPVWAHKGEITIISIAIDTLILLDRDSVERSFVPEI